MSDVKSFFDILSERCRAYLAEDHLCSHLEIPSGLYWKVSGEDMFNINREPEQLGVGDFDYEIEMFNRRQKEGAPPISDDIALLSNYLAALYSKI